MGFFLGEVHATSGDIGIWRDSAGSQIPGTAFAPFSFATQERNDGVSFTGNNTITLDETGNYLVIATLKFTDSSNGRVNYEGRFAHTGSGDFTTLYGTGYGRNNNNRTAWVRVVGLVWGGAINDTLKLEMRRDTDTPIGGSVINASHLQIIQLNEGDSVGMYTDTTDTGTYGTTTWTDVPFNNIVLENDTDIIARQSGNTDIQLQQNDTTFLIGYGMSFGTGGSRTQRVTKMVANTTDISQSFSYEYQRSSANEYMDPNGLFLYRTTSALVNLSVQSQLGHADVAGSALRKTNTSGFFVIELPSTAETFISHDGTGNQDVGGTSGDLNLMEVVDYNDSAAFTKVNNTTVNSEKAMDVLLMSQVYIDRTSGTSSVRATTGSRFEIQGVDQTLGEYGNYLRGDQASMDTYSNGLSSSGLYSVSSGDDIQVEWFDAGDNGAVDYTQANASGFSAFNISSIATAKPNTNQLHFRWRDDTTALNTSGGWVATEDTTLTGVVKQQGYRLRVEVANTGELNETAARTYEIQFGEKTSSCANISSWTGIADASGMFDSSHISNGQATTALLSNSEAYTFVAGEGHDTSDTTGSIGPLTKDYYTELEYSFRPTVESVTGKTYCFRLYDTTANKPLQEYSVYPTLTMSSSSVLQDMDIMEWGTQASVGDDAWTTVNFTNEYHHPVFICTSEYNANIGNESDGTADSVVCRVQNVGSTSAQVRLQESGTLVGATGNLTDETIHWMVVEAGEYDTGDIKMEAFTYTSTVTDGKTNGWAGEEQTLNQTYTNLVVLGQVMTTNDTGHSQFWAHNGVKGAPTDGAVYTGKHVSEDSNITRSNETIGVVAIEQANDSLDGTVYESRIQGQTIERIDDTHTSYTFNTAFSSTPQVAIISLSGVNGSDGPITSLYGTSPLSTTQIHPVIMETEIVDTEQSGSPEHVPYIVFESAGTYSASDDIALDMDTFRFYENTDAIQPTVALGNENIDITGVDDGDVLRIRSRIQVGHDLNVNAMPMKLQYGEGGTCSAIGSWTDVGGIGSGSIWRGYNNATPADGVAISSALLTHSDVLQTYEEENNTATNVAITDGEHGEWDWVVENNGATGNTNYCFRITKSDGSVFYYTEYPKLTTSTVAASPTFTLDSYRWYTDNDATNPADVWGDVDLAENTSITLLPAGNDPLNNFQEIRLRTNFTVNTNPLSATDKQFKLQYKLGTDGDCTTGSWISVGAAQTWEFATSSITDGALVTSSLSGSDVAGQYAKTNPTTTNTNSATATQQIEYDFHLIGTNTVDATQYSFRVIESDDTVFDAYTNCPTLITEPGMSKMMRGGNFFTPDAGIEEGFFWTE